MRCALLFLLAASLLAGCGNSAEKDGFAGVPPRGEAPPSEFYEQVRAGSFQIAQAQDLIAEAYAEGQKLPAKLGEERAEVIETLDAVGQNLGKYREPPPPEAEFQRQIAEHEKRRDEAVTLANDSIQDLDFVREVIAGILEKPLDEKTADQLATVDTLIADGIDTLTDAIKAYGGTVETPAG